MCDIYLSLEQLDGVRSYGKRRQSQGDDGTPSQSFEEYFELNEVNQQELKPGEKRVSFHFYCLHSEGFFLAQIFMDMK